MLTLYIIPIEGKNIKLLIKSFEGIDCNIVRFRTNIDFNKKSFTKWKMFMYAGEYLSDELRKAIPIFLEHDEFDAFKIYRKGNNGYSISPRIFKSGVVLPKNSLLPMDDCKMEIILNGFILEND